MSTAGNSLSTGCPRRRNHATWGRPWWTAPTAGFTPRSYPEQPAHLLRPGHEGHAGPRTARPQRALSREPGLRRGRLALLRHRHGPLRTSSPSTPDRKRCASWSRKTRGSSGRRGSFRRGRRARLRRGGRPMVPDDGRHRAEAIAKETGRPSPTQPRDRLGHADRSLPRRPPTGGLQPSRKMAYGEGPEDRRRKEDRASSSDRAAPASARWPSGRTG